MALGSWRSVTSMGKTKSPAPSKTRLAEAYASEYIANILEQRQRLTPAPGPLHLTRRADLLELGAPDLTFYDPQ